MLLRLLVATSLLAAIGCTQGSSLASTPSAPTNAPTPAPAPEAGFTLTLNSLGSQEAITGVSEITVDASASTGSELRYFVDFGDGSTANEAVARHVYHTAGTYRVTVTLTDATDRTAMSTRELVVASPLGTWLYAGYLPRIPWFEVRTLRLTEQQGGTVRGVLSRGRERDSAVTGTLTPDRQIRLVIDGLSETLEGVVPSVLSGNREVWTLAARGGPMDGQTLTFTPRVEEPSGPPPDAVLKMRFFSFSAPFAIRGISPMLFDGSTSRGDGLTYFIEFGDQRVSTSASAVHPIDEAGHYTARLTVVDRFGRSDFETNEFEVRTLVAEGYYVGWQGQDSWLTIGYQQGTEVRGHFTRQPTSFHASFVGSADANGNVRLTLDNGVMLVGSLTLGTGAYTNRMLLTYVGGPENGTTLELYFRNGY